MLLGDLTRQGIEAEAAKSKSATPPNYDIPRDHLTVAKQTLEGLSGTFDTHFEWALDYSQVLTRLGDLDRIGGNLTSAEQNYLAEQATTMRVFQTNQLPRPAIYNAIQNFAYGNEVREVAWGYRKLGDVQNAQHHQAAAVKSLSNEVCVRHYLTNLDASNALWARDLGFALTKLGDVLVGPDAPDRDAASLAYYEAMDVRLDLAQLQGSESIDRSSFAAGLRKVANLIRTDGNAQTAAQFETAAAQVQKATQTQPAGLDSGATGIWDNVDSAAKKAVLQYDAEFIRPKLTHAGEGAETCWNDLVKTFANNIRAADVQK
jgi:hypothetical protein